uniref:ANK_REP_REGION domain-containing protein n=1 Tax=Parastrongyloides trichosuri TaxID=131310 RepID=A0A0N4Z6E2_PARTI
MTSSVNTELFEKICSCICLEDHLSFNKLIKDPIFDEIIKLKDGEGRSLLTIACMSDKPKICSILLKKGLSLDDIDNNGRTSLHWTVKCEAMKTLKWMFTLPISEGLILAKDSNDVTSLHIAATKSSARILKLLLNAVTKNEELLGKLFDKYSRIPLHYAASSGSLECVEEFMDETLYLPVSIRDVYGNNPLMLACGNKYAAEVIRCLSNKKSISVTARNGQGMSPLHISVLANNVAGVKILLQECKISTEIYDEDARTPLHYAAQNGREEIVELLLEAGARHNATDAYSSTPAHYAAESNFKILRSLLMKNNGIDVIDKEGRTSFMWAVSSGNEDVVSEMLRHFNIPRNGKDNHQSTALHLAALTGNASICKILIQQGWMPTAEDHVGATPLHIAAGKGFTNLVQILCTSDEAVNKVDISQRTALFYAAFGGQAHTLNVMISDLGFNPNAEDILDRTPLHAAAYGGFAACVQKLIDNNVDVNAIDRDEETPLHVAASRGKEEVVVALLNAGATVNPYSRVNGTTPLTYAMFNRYMKIVDILKTRNAITGEELRHIAASLIQRSFRAYIKSKKMNVSIETDIPSVNLSQNSDFRTLSSNFNDSSVKSTTVSSFIRDRSSYLPSSRSSYDDLST